jgi:hypothetical protein
MDLKEAHILYMRLCLSSILFHLCLALPSDRIPSDFPTNKLYAFHISPIRATYSAHLILHDLITLMQAGACTNYEAPHYVVFRSLLLLSPI